MGIMFKIFLFWWRVLLRYFKSAASILDSRGQIMTVLIRCILVLGTTVGVTQKFVSITVVASIIQDWNWILQVIPYLVVGLFVLLGINLISQPSVMYEELGGFEDPTLRALVECEPRRYSEAWAGIRIYNDHPRLSISQCNAYFKSAIRITDGRNKLTRSGEKLSWTNADPPTDGDKDVPALGNKFVDVVKTDHHNNRIIFCTQGTPDLYKDKAGVDEYQIIVGVRGVFANKSFDEEIVFTVKYKGDVDLECEPAKEIFIGKVKNKPRK